jgi:hypothetical protein
MMCELASLILAAFAFTVPAHTQENAPEPEGYRTDNYHAFPQRLPARGFDRRHQGVAGGTLRSLFRLLLDHSAKRE